MRNTVPGCPFEHRQYRFQGNFFSRTNIVDRITTYCYKALCKSFGYVTDIDPIPGRISCSKKGDGAMTRNLIGKI